MYYRSMEVAMVEAIKEAFPDKVSSKEGVMKVVHLNFGNVSRKAKKTR